MCHIVRASHHRSSTDFCDKVTQAAAGYDFLNKGLVLGHRRQMVTQKKKVLNQFNKSIAMNMDPRSKNPSVTLETHTISSMIEAAIREEKGAILLLSRIW